MEQVIEVSNVSKVSEVSRVLEIPFETFGPLETFATSVKEVFYELWLPKSLLNRGNLSNR